MRKVFVTLCPQDSPPFLPEGINTELYYAPIYEHAYKKIENAVKVLNLDLEVVRASGCNIPGTISEITAGLEDIVIFASQFVFFIIPQNPPSVKKSVENPAKRCYDNAKGWDFLCVM